MARFYHSINAGPGALPDGCERFTVHLGTLPDGTHPRFQFVELALSDPAGDDTEDPRVVPLPDRLFFDVETTDGRHITVDADIHDDGLPVVGYPGSIAVRTVTVGAVGGGAVELQAVNDTTIPAEWVELAFGMAALHAGGGPGLTVDFGPDAPEGWQPDPTAGREMIRRLRAHSGPRRGRPGPDTETVEQALNLRELGRSYKEIADQLGVSKSNVHRWVKQAEAERELGAVNG